MQGHARRSEARGGVPVGEDGRRLGTRPPRPRRLEPKGTAEGSGSGGGGDGGTPTQRHSRAARERAAWTARASGKVGCVSSVPVASGRQRGRRRSRRLVGLPRADGSGGDGGWWMRYSDERPPHGSTGTLPGAPPQRNWLFQVVHPCVSILSIPAYQQSALCATATHETPTKYG